MRRLKKFNEGWKNGTETEDHTHSQNIARKYIYMLRDGKELNEEQKEFLNEYFKYPNLYNILVDWLQNKFDIFSKYSKEDIEDRLIEFFDQVPDWEPYVMFSLHMKYSGGESWLGISSDKINSKEYFLHEMSSIFSDLMFHTGPRKYKYEVTIDHYLQNKRPSISLHFNRTNESNKSYNLLFLEELCDKIVNRLSKLYKIIDVRWDYNRYTGRLYDPDTDVNDYTLSLIIE